MNGDDLSRNATVGDIIRLRKDIKKWQDNIESDREEDIEDGIENHEYKCDGFSDYKTQNIFWVKLGVVVAGVSSVVTFVGSMLL